MNAEALEFAKKVYKYRSITVYFTRIPKECEGSCSSRLHPTYILHIDVDGHIFRNYVRGLHCLPARSYEEYLGNSVETFARAAQDLLEWQREVNPTASYPDAGVIISTVFDDDMNAHQVSRKVYF